MLQKVKKDGYKIIQIYNQNNNPLYQGNISVHYKTTHLQTFFLPNKKI